MNKAHKHAELIKAWADGAKIQFLHEYSEEWRTIDDPTWDVDIKFRIKPEPDKGIYVNLYETGGGQAHKTLIDALNKKDLACLGTLHCIISGETGKLKSVEVIK